MKVRVLYRPDSPEEKTVEDLMNSLERYKIRPKPELINVDSAEGQSLVEIYDLVRHPAVIVTKDDGQIIKKWVENMPRPTDVSYYLH